MSLIISNTAFAGSIPSCLTNEIPHLSVYSLLNANLRNTWSSELIGKTFAKYGDSKNSVKTVNGVQSEVYKAADITFVDPSTGLSYTGNIPKIDFTVEGAFETEMDYLMHEFARYLSKLYPDDFNSLYTLTEAERQTYFNEALHMVHSYFDTEQISINDERIDLYLRNRFLTGITAIRAKTGVITQEEELLNLLNYGNINSYAGYVTFADANGSLVYSNKGALEWKDWDNLVLDGFYYLDESNLNKKALLKLNGKIKSNSLKDFLESPKDIYRLQNTKLNVFNPMYRLPEATESLFLNHIVHGSSYNDINLNDWFTAATAQGIVKAGASLKALEDSSFGSIKKFNVNSKDQQYFVFDTDTTSPNCITFDKNLNWINPINIENSLFVTQGYLKDLKNLYLLKTSECSYTERFLVAVGNYVVSQLINLTQTEEFLRAFQGVVGADTKTLQMLVTVSQDGKHILSGLLNKSFWGDFDFSKETASHYDYTQFNSAWIATKIFSHLSYYKDAELLNFSSRNQIDFQFEVISMDQGDLFESYIIQDNTKGSEPGRIAITPIADGYKIALTFKQNQKVVNYNGTTAQGTLIADSGEANINCSFDAAKGSVTIGETEYFLSGFEVYTKDAADKPVKVGERLEFVRGNQYFLSYKYIHLCKSFEASLQRLQGQILDETYDIKTVYRNPNNLLFEDSSDVNTTLISIDWFISLQDFILANTSYAIETSVTTAGTYINATRLVLNESIAPIECEKSFINFAKIFFTASDINYYTLQTYKCEFVSNDTVRIEKDIVKTIRQYGRVNTILFDTHGKVYPNLARRSYTKNAYCYISFEHKSDFPQGEKGILIVDLEKTIDTNSKVFNTPELEKRHIVSKNLYRLQDQYYFYNFTWENLKRENINYVMDNIFSEDVKDLYKDTAKISTLTKIPTSLTELEYITLVDAKDQSLNQYDLYNDLIHENKSLYLDSATKYLLHVPMNLHNLVYCKQYDTYSYLINDSVPAYITYFNSDDYLMYEPLKNLIEADQKNEITLEEIQKIQSRRYIIWGNVVWDANNVNKSVKTLRTIWAGYFTNFEIYLSDDLIPSLPTLTSLSGGKKVVKRDQEIFNYNYCSNKGNPELDWSFATGFSKTDQGVTKVSILDSYSHAAVNEPGETQTLIDNSDVDKLLHFVDSFSFEANRLDLKEDALRLKDCSSIINNIDIGKLRLTYTETKDLVQEYKKDNYTFQFMLNCPEGEDGNYTIGNYYKLRLIYNMLHIEGENFQSTKLFNNFCKGNVPLEMFMDYFLFQYITDKIIGYRTKADLKNIATEKDVYRLIESKELDLTPEFKLQFIASLYNGDRYIKKDEDGNYCYLSTGEFEIDETAAWEDYLGIQVDSLNKLTLDLKKVLDYIVEFNTYIPAIAALTEDYKLKIYYFRLIKHAENDYEIRGGSFLETLNGDLLNSLMPLQYKDFQVKASLYNKYTDLASKYQYFIASQATGSINNFSLKLDEESTLSLGYDLLDVTLDKEFLTKYEYNAEKGTFNQEGEEELKKLVYQANGSEVDLENLKIDSTGRVWKKKNDGQKVIQYQNAIRDQEEYLTDIFSPSKGLNVSGKRLYFNNAATFELTSNTQAFREYKLATIQLGVEEAESADADLQRCYLHFDQDYQLQDNGFLYLTDIKAPNKRTSYSSSRETQIVERDFTVENMHLLAFQEQQDDYIRLIFQDSNRDQTRSLLNTINNIKPIEEGLHEQLITDTKLRFGFTWIDPNVNIGYKFYKRKFVVEGSTGYVNPTTITLTDPDLTNDKSFKLEDHISVGDAVQLYILNPSSTFIEGQTVTLGPKLDNEDLYYGPYKVIYQGTQVTDGVQQLRLILTGPGNIVRVTADLNGSKGLDISEPITFDATHKYTAFTVDTIKPDATRPSGAIVYRDDDESIHLIAYLNDLFIDPETNEGSNGLSTGYELLKDKYRITDANGQLVENTNVLFTISSTKMQTPKAAAQVLVYDHTSWEAVDQTDAKTDDEPSELNQLIQTEEDALANEELLAEFTEQEVEGRPTQIVESITLPNSSINFDNYDRMFLQSSDPEVVNGSGWLSNPAEAEMFDASGIYDKIATSKYDEDDKTTYVEEDFIDNADDDSLKTFIRETLIKMFDEGSTAANTLANSNIQASDTDEDVSLTLPPTDGIFTTTADTHIEAALVPFAKIIYQAGDNVSIDLKNAPIFLPTFQDFDVPVFLETGCEPKWRKIKIITGTTNRAIENASSDELKTFARTLLPTNYVTRKAPKVSSWIKSGNYIVAWDQTTGSMIVMDKIGNVKGRVAIPTIGYKQPIVTDDISHSKLSSAYCINNRLYMYNEETLIAFENYVAQANNRSKVNETEGIYSVFDKNGTLYLPKVLKNVDVTGLNKQQKALVDFAKDVASYEAYRDYCKYLDFMAPDAGEYISFKDESHVCNFKTLGEVLEIANLTTELAAWKEVLNILADTMLPKLVKGMPYFTENTLTDENFSVLKGTTSISTVGSTTYAFESLIKYSGMEIVGTKALLYGEINWPKISDVTEVIKSNIAAKVAKSPNVAIEYKDLIADQFAIEAEAELKANFAAFTSEESYPENGGIRPFNVTVDLETLQITNVVNDGRIIEENIVPSAIKSIKVDGEKITAITEDGTYDYGDPASSIISPDTQNVQNKRVNADDPPVMSGSVTLVYDAIKNVDSFGRINIEDGVIEIQLKGTVVANADVVLSTIASVDQYSFKLRDDTIVLNEGETVNVIALVKDFKKDNFQFGYGHVTSMLDYLTSAKTLFQVPSYHYADFATYDNADSLERPVMLKDEFGNDTDQIAYWKTDSVFDLYPTFEKIDDDKKANFYKVDSKGNATYLKNDLGKFILRMSPMFGDISGGQIINLDKANVDTIAGEAIDNQALANNINLLISDKKAYQLDYIDLFTNFKPQKVPALVSNPLGAVIKYPYKEVALDIIPDENTKIEAYDDYIVATVKLADSSFDVIKDQYTGNKVAKYAQSNLGQMENVLGKQTDYEDIPIETLATSSATKHFYEKKPDGSYALIVGNRVTSKGLTFANSLTDPTNNVLTVQGSVSATVTNGTIQGTTSVDWEGHLGGIWNVLQQNLTVSSMRLYIANKTNVLPRFVPITKYKAKSLKSGDLKILTSTSHELYIPNKGYGQALLGDYKTPIDCLFEDGTFFNTGLNEFKKRVEKAFTVNENGEKFLLVDANGKPVYNSDNSIAVMPAMMYKSFAAADSDLAKDLPTINEIGVSDEILIDMSIFEEVDMQNVFFEKQEVLTQLDFVKGTVDGTADALTAKKSAVYDLFKNRLKLSCKLTYSKWKPDVTSKLTVKIPNSLLDTIGYTRLYRDESVPINYQYLTRDGTYEITKVGGLRDLTRYSCNKDGGLLYYDLNGKISYTATYNPPIAALASIENVHFFDISRDLIESIVTGCFYISHKSVSFEYRNSMVCLIDSVSQKSIICIQNPNEALSNFSKIRRTVGWTEPVLFKPVFDLDNLTVDLVYKEASQSYNFVYLYDKDKNLVGKVFFKNKINENNLLIFSKELN